MRNRMIRIFVSSTFQDFKSERDLLAKEVYPELEELCRNNGFSFQIIDLRWGVSQQNSMDNRSLQICFDEIERCRKISPKPNFLVLSGWRYGWIPLPCSIAEKEWEILVNGLSEDSREYCLLSKWYRQDCNDWDRLYILQPRTGEYQQADVWAQTEKELKEVLFALAKERLSEDSLVQYGLSATEQEIYHGLFWAQDACSHTLVLMREGAPGECQDESDLIPAKFLQEKIRTFSDGEVAPKILPYRIDEEIPLKAAKEYLKNIIEEQIAAVTDLSLYEQECNAVDAELRKVMDTYIPVSDNNERFQEFVEKDRGRAVVAKGLSGSGKTTMLKYWHGNHRENSVAVFADVQPQCRSILHALRFCIRRLTEMGYIASVEEVLDYDNCLEWFEKQLSQGRGKMPLTVILDSVDQMSDWKQLRRSIFQMKLPENITLVISCISEDSLTEYDKRLSVPTFEMHLLGKMSAVQMLEAKLAMMHRRLSNTSENAQKSIIEKMLPEEVSPLYIQFLGSLCYKLHSYDRPDFPKFATIKELIRYVIERQSVDNYPVLYQHTLGYFLLAKDGFSEQEILEILSLDRQVCDEIRSQTEWDFKGKVPSVLWARLYCEIDDFLMEVDSGGIRLFRFSHVLLNDVLREFIGEETLAQLAGNIKQFFTEQPLTYREQDGSLLVNTRKINELYPILSYLQDWEKIGELLKNPIYIDCYIRCGMYQEILAQLTRLKSTSQFTTAHNRILKILKKNYILLQTWNDCFRQLMCGEGLAEPSILEKVGQKYFLKRERVSRAEESQLYDQAVFIPDSSSRKKALRGDGIIAILSDGMIQMFDWNKGVMLPVTCEVGAEYSDIYWEDDKLVVRGEYCRKILCFGGEELYVTEQMTCESVYNLRKEGGQEEVVKHAGGMWESDIVLWQGRPVFFYYTGKKLKKTELFYPNDITLRIYLNGSLAAVLIDFRRIEIVDLDRRRVLQSFDLGCVSNIAWCQSGEQILVSLEDDRILVLSVELSAEGTELTGPDEGYAAYQRRYKYSFYQKEAQQIVSAFSEQIWNESLPVKQEVDNCIPILAAFSVEKDWVAYYYNYYNQGIVRLHRLSDGEILGESQVDMVFQADAVRTAFYPACSGKKLVLISKGREHVLDIGKMKWKEENGEAMAGELYPALPKAAEELLRHQYPEEIRNCYPPERGEDTLSVGLPWRTKIMEKCLEICMEIVVSMLSIVSLRPFRKMIKMKKNSLMWQFRQLENLPVYGLGGFYVMPNTSRGLLHVCDSAGNWICHEQFERPIWAVDIVNDEIHVLLQNSLVPVVMKLENI